MSKGCGNAQSHPSLGTGTEGGESGGLESFSGSSKGEFRVRTALARGRVAGAPIFVRTPFPMGLGTREVSPGVKVHALYAPAQVSCLALPVVTPGQR